MIDWRELIFLLADKTGLRYAQIASRLHIPPSTLNALKNGTTKDPLFSTGVRLLDYYVENCGREVPML